MGVLPAETILRKALIQAGIVPKEHNIANNLIVMRNFSIYKNHTKNDEV
jgi:hypothetical protein